jgi:hypothetical protein
MPVDLRLEGINLLSNLGQEWRRLLSHRAQALNELLVREVVELVDF